MLRTRVLKTWSAAAFAAGLTLAAPCARSAEPALFEAVRSGNVSRVAALLNETRDVDRPAADGSTALLAAVETGNAAIVDLLLEAGARVDLANAHHFAPLSVAAANGDAPLVTRLLAHGARPDELSGEGQTALMLAARNGRPKAVQLLLDAGANVHATEPFRGQTALMWAAGGGNAEAARLLLEHGARLVRTPDGEPCEDEADACSAALAARTGADATLRVGVTAGEPPRVTIRAVPAEGEATSTSADAVEGDLLSAAAAATEEILGRVGSAVGFLVVRSTPPGAAA